MASVAEDLRTLLLESGTVRALVDQRIHQSKMPEQSAYPAVWFMRAGRDAELTHDGDAGLTAHEFALECLSTQLAEAEDLAEAVWDYLHGYRGAMGTRTVQGIFCSNQDDDYLPRGAAGDETVYTSALALLVWST